MDGNLHSHFYTHQSVLSPRLCPKSFPSPEQQYEVKGTDSDLGGVTQRSRFLVEKLAVLEAWHRSTVVVHVYDKQVVFSSFHKYIVTALH
uniref:Uncharacterized protein n=1 Tax=Anguilla anguilla TaxID=7936 RepID=A0A0E9V0B1_ANGAN